VVSQRGDGVQGFQRSTRVTAFVPSGSYADHAALDTASIYVVPDGLDFGAAGGVGALAVQIAKLKGAGKVIGLASPSKHEFVKSLGADAVSDYTQPGWAKDICLDSQSACG
jgi:NADPH2:quinone reductase